MSALLIVSLLALSASMLVLVGVAGLVAGLVLPLLPPEVLEPTLRSGLPQLVVLAASAMALMLGLQSFRWLRVNAGLARSALRSRSGRAPAPPTPQAVDGWPAPGSQPGRPFRIVDKESR